MLRDLLAETPVPKTELAHRLGEATPISTTTDLLDETRVSMTGLARLVEVTIPTIWRWRQKGVRGVRLETFMVGGRRYTTHEAYRRFVAATTLAADGGQPPSTSARTSRQRQAAIARAEAELDAPGI